MTTPDPVALRVSIETRLSNRANELGVDVNRLRRHFVFQRMLVRLAASRHWVLKGGFALEARLLTQARATKDLDLASLSATDERAVRDDIIEALDSDEGDALRFTVSTAKPIKEDQAGNPGWRYSVEASMAGRSFAKLTLDVVARAAEIEGGTEVVQLPAPVSDLSTAQMPTVDLAQHAAEKLHALTRRYGDRPNSRVKDLIDLALLHESGLLDRDRVAARFRVVCEARDGRWPPQYGVEVPASWAAPYEQMRGELRLDADLSAATQLTFDLFTYAIGGTA